MILGRRTRASTALSSSSSAATTPIITTMTDNDVMSSICGGGGGGGAVGTSSMCTRSSDSPIDEHFITVSPRRKEIKMDINATVNTIKNNVSRTINNRQNNQYSTRKNPMCANDLSNEITKINSINNNNNNNNNTNNEHFENTNNNSSGKRKNNRTRKLSINNRSNRSSNRSNSTISQSQVITRYFKIKKRNEEKQLDFHKLIDSDDSLLSVDQLLSDTNGNINNNIDSGELANHDEDDDDDDDDDDNDNDDNNNDDDDDDDNLTNHSYDVEDDDIEIIVDVVSLDGLPPHHGNYNQVDVNVNEDLDEDDDITQDYTNYPKLLNGNNNNYDENDADDDNSSTASNTCSNNNNNNHNNVNHPHDNDIIVIADDNDDYDHDNNCNNQNYHNNSKTISNDSSNLFLQEPVLHLNIDKSLNQPSSITINKHLEVRPDFNELISVSFASIVNGLTTTKMTDDHHSSTANIGLTKNVNDQNNITVVNNNNNNNNNKHSPKVRKIKVQNEINNKNTSNVYEIEKSIQSDSSSSSSSCDSGVVIDDDTTITDLSGTELTRSRRRKPLTPHRILCPSPVKRQIIAAEKNHSTATALSNLQISNSNNNNNNNNVNNNDSNNGRKRRGAKKRLNVDNIEIKSEIKPEILPIISEIHKYEKDVVQVKNNYENPESRQNDEDKKDIKIKIEQIINDDDCFENINGGGRVGTKITKMTDYFPVRRSVRKTKKTVELEQLRKIEKAIQENQQDGLSICKLGEKGRGVIAERTFAKGEFVIEYIGDFIDINEANRREQIYTEDENAGCYMYYFKHKNQQYCIDATAESNYIGRLVNHSRTGNLLPRTINYKNRPHLVLLAKEEINIGDELTYDYGDRSKESLLHHPWLAF